MRNALRVVLLVTFVAAALVVLRHRPGTTSTTDPVRSADPPTTTVARRGLPLADAIAGSVPPRFDRASTPGFGGCEAKGQRSPVEFDVAITHSSWPREQWDKVCRVVACESMWQADARRASGRSSGAGRGVVHYLGYFQIEDRSWGAEYDAMGFDDAAMLTAVPNLNFGFWLWTNVGGAQWSTAQWDCAAA